MPQVEFQHPNVQENKPLVVEIGIDQIGWSYNLNTAAYPTYGGEVIQILSVYVDNLIVGGTIVKYRRLKEIYTYFAEYMIIASQGNINEEGSYVQTPMVFRYPHREWEFEIQPLSAPSYRVGLEVIAPTWQMEAHVVDRTSPTMNSLRNLIIQQAQYESETGEEEFKLNGVISPDNADPTTNPFASPMTNKGNEWTPQANATTNEAFGELADYYNSLLPSYLKGELLHSITNQIGARPASGKTAAPSEEKTEAKKLEEKVASRAKRK